LTGTKKYKVTITERADDMMVGHADFLAEVSLGAADRLLSQFDKIGDRIAENPFQFPFADHIDLPNIPPKTFRKCLFEDRYKALFHLEGKNATIVAVIDSRRENRDVLETDE